MGSIQISIFPVILVNPTVFNSSSLASKKRPTGLFKSRGEVTSPLPTNLNCPRTRLFHSQSNIINILIFRQLLLIGFIPYQAKNLSGFLLGMMQKRKSIRLKEYDYSMAGGYFVTVCAFRQQCLFGKIIDGKARLNKWGNIVESEWLETRAIRPNVELD